MSRVRWLLLLLLVVPLSAHAQFGSPARRVISGATLPTTCLSSVMIKDVFYKTGTGAGWYVCTAGPGTWTLTADGGAGGLQPAGGFTVSPRTVRTGQYADAAPVTPVNTEFYFAEVLIPCNMTVTGVTIPRGTAAGNLKVGLADSTGAVVATSASTAYGAGDDLNIPFTGTYAAKGPATYYVLLMFDTNTTPTFVALGVGFGYSIGTGKKTGQVFATGFTAITPPTTFTADLGPVASLY